MSPIRFRRGESTHLWYRVITVLFAIGGVLASGCLVVNVPSDHVEYPVAGAFSNREEIYWGNIDNNLRNGTAFVQAIGEQSGNRCTGEGHLAQPAANCVGGGGVCHVTCSDGTTLDCEYKLTSCTSGYGVGLDAQKNWFAFAFGPGITRQDRNQLSNTLRQVASSLPQQPSPSTSEATAKPTEKSEVSLGTGFFVSSNGVLVTADHVVQGRKKIAVMDRHGAISDATLLNDDPANDIALLKVRASAKPLRVVPTRGVMVGQQVLTLGYPLPQLQGTEQKATFGHINALSGSADDVRLMQIDVPVQPGNSGGPLLDGDGDVIGVVNSGLEPGATLKIAGTVPQNVNYATKADYLFPLLSHESISVAERSHHERTLELTQIIERVRDSVVLIVAQ
jgi:V8-like Glu-specific endopeptidase